MSIVICKEKSLTLKTIRKELRLTQTKFANLMGVDLRSVQYWEAGERTPAFSVKQMKILDGLLKQIGKSIQDLPDDLTN